MNVIARRARSLGTSLHALGAVFALAVVAVSLAGVVALGGGCGPKGGASGDSTKTSGAASNIKVGLVFDVGGRGDKSFNDSAYAGLERAMKELGIPQENVQYIEPGEGGDRESALRQLAAGPSSRTTCSRWRRTSRPRSSPAST